MRCGMRSEQADALQMVTDGTWLSWQRPLVCDGSSNNEDCDVPYTLRNERDSLNLLKPINLFCNFVLFYSLLFCRRFSRGWNWGESRVMRIEAMTPNP